MKNKRFQKENLRRGIYLLPNMFTSMNLFCGFYAIIASIDGKFVAAAIAIIIAGVFDSFGIAPGLMIYLWALKPLGRIGWLAAFVFMACGALRLARFNTQVGAVSSDHFIGLPIPAGAGMNAVTVLIFHKLNIMGSANAILLLIMLYSLSFLMVSSIKYNSFKKPELFRRMNFNSLVIAILIFIFIASQPSIALFLCGVLYVLSGPVTMLKRYKKIKQKETGNIKGKENTSHLS